MNSAIDATTINYSYGNLPILENLSFSVPKGDFFIVIGPNGSGKTTLMKVISGLLKNQKGNLKILNRPIQSYTRKELAKTIAFVPQTISVDFPFTVMEVVLMGRSPHLGMLGLEKEEDLEAAKQALVFTGVNHLANRKVDQLSGGEQQRVFIAPTQVY